ncbi:autotransporter domain-containing protein [Pseudomonas lijiangensis]|uniref:Autotransporter domain-containing protein n=2 Tax=Pseudomonas lijiangensis TaxID=2995658 RepID=A0ABX8HM88_9PSED|nr:autotransporter domain-containing protein [Pseudomonas lijiangensis]MBX8503890.1 autotransporter domain-containing protein [Pseudomonas lijiangensis]QWU81720.1 autotransporter domain-containing protein [Pseudomonas lijiangensis]
MNRTFQKTLLALLIGACACQAHSQDYDVSQGRTALINQTLTGDFNLIGQVSLQSSGSENIFQFQRSVLNGSFVNAADITVDANGHVVNGLGIANAPDLLFTGGGLGGTINGDLRNNGSITILKANRAEGMQVGNLIVTGSVINAGHILMSDEPGLVSFGSAEGIYLHGTQIGGDLINSGSIEVRGEDAGGLIIDFHTATAIFSLGGKLINSGSILVVGNNSVGLDIESPTSPLHFDNSGSIVAQGLGAESINLWEGTLDVLNNSGLVSATGSSDSHAIMVQGIDFTTTNPSGSRGIVNTGTITSQGDTIVVTRDALPIGFEINQKAGFIASDSGAAIRGRNLATLNWSGGEIRGDLLDMAAVNVQGMATFKGAIIDSNVVVQGGSLNLDRPGSSITGNLQLANLGALDMRLSDSVVNTTPYLTVAGAATFAAGSRITLSANPGDFTPVTEGKTYALLSAGSVQNNGLTVNSASALLDVASYSVDADSVSAVVRPKSDQQVSQELDNAGGDQRTQGLINRFKNNVMGQLDSNDRVFQSFANANSAQLAELGKQLSPDVSRGGVDAALAGQGASRSALDTRMTGLRSGLSSGDELSDTGVWMQALNSNMDQDSRGGVEGYSANASGVAVGVDGQFSSGATLGFAYSYVNANATSDIGYKTDVQGNALSLYGSWDKDNWFAQGSVSYGRNDNDSRRYVAGTLAKGNFDSDVLSISTLAGYGLRLSDHILLEPRVGARYSNVQVDAYTEHGSTAALRNSDQRFETGEVGAGLRVASEAPLLGGTLTPELTLMTYHDLIGDRISQTSAFAQGGSSFVVTGAKSARDSYEGSVGVSYAISALTLGTSYTYQGRSGYDAETLMFKARYAF